MAADETSGPRAGPVVLRIKLRYPDLDTMVQRFAPNVGKAGLFLPTRAMQPVGTEVKFELRLADDTPVLVGLGRVKSARPPDPADSRATFGMAIELMRVTREGREVIIRMIERRRAMGLRDVAIPMPADVDAARRSDVDTAPRADLAGVISDAMPAAPAEAPVLAAAPASPTTPAASSRPAIAIARLAPEPARPRRPAVAELVARAAELAITPASAELDEHVDVDRALARARDLAAGDLDADLEALREDAAAPFAEITVEAASAELARRLGGKPIAKRDRSARWDGPLGTPAPGSLHTIDDLALGTPAPGSLHTIDDAVAEPVLADASGPARADAVEPAPETAASPVAAEPAAAEIAARAAPAAEVAPPAEVAPAVEIAGPAEVAATDGPPPEPPAPPEPAARRAPALLVDDDADLASFERAFDASRIHTGQTLAAPEPADDEEPLADDDIEPIEDAGEATHIGAMPAGERMFATVPSGPADLADRLDAHLDAAEAELDADVANEIRETEGERLEEGDLLDVAEAAPADAIAAPDEDPVAAADAFAAAQAEAIAAAEALAAETDGLDEDDAGAEEISDLDVLAEADADDADLLGADGETDASGAHAPLDAATPVDGSYPAPPAPEWNDDDPAAEWGADEPRATVALSPEEPQAAAWPAEEPRTSASWPAEEPRTSASWPAEDPRTAASWPADAPRTSASWPAEEPRTAASWPAEEPSTAGPWPAEAPRTAASWPAEEPSTAGPWPADGARETPWPAEEPQETPWPVEAARDTPWPADEAQAKPWPAESPRTWPAAVPERGKRPSAWPRHHSLSFADRLDLGDEDDDDPAAATRASSSGPFDAPSSTFTFAERAPEPEDNLSFDEPHAFSRDSYDSIAAPPAPREPEMLGEPPADPYDLEAALEQLDVDLDELSVTAEPATSPPVRPRTGGQPRAPRAVAADDRLAPRRPQRAATEDDGVLIDFDDDE